MEFCRLPGASLARILALALALAGLAGCATGRLPSGQPSFYRSLAHSGARVDAAAARAMLSGYRHSNGLPGVTIDPELMRLAAQQAKAMASANRLSHNVIGTLGKRLQRAGYRAREAAENLSAGYYTIADAFSGWRSSPPHRANMLLRHVTRMGIAAAYAPHTRYKVFWSLILAQPVAR